MKKRKIVIPSGILAVVFLILLFSFGSSCGCLNPDEEFARFIDLIEPRQITPEAVQVGFERHFPIGTILKEENLLKLSEDGENIFKKNEKSYICTYYYEHSGVAKRGYRIVIDLEHHGTIAKVRTAKISKWFGVEFSKL